MRFRTQNPHGKHNLQLLDSARVPISGKKVQLRLQDYVGIAGGELLLKEHTKGQYASLVEGNTYSIFEDGTLQSTLSPICVADPAIFLLPGMISVPDGDAILGSGEDGDVIITKTTHLTASMNYHNLTVNKFYYPSGTVSVSADGTTITGSGTSFLTDVAVGDTIYIADEFSVVQTVINDTSLTTVDDFSTHTNSAFHLSVTLFSDSWKITVKNNLYLYGKISNDGGRPIPYSGWIGVPSGFYPSMGDGQNGGLGGGGIFTPGYGHVPGAPGSDAPSRLNCDIDYSPYTLSGVGGGGGSSSSTIPIEVGGPGGNSGLPSTVTNYVSARTLDIAQRGRIFTFNGVQVFYINLISGGGGGGGQGGGSVTIGVAGAGGDGGRSGAPGGILYVAAKNIIGDGKFSAKGGNGDWGNYGGQPPMFPNCGYGGGGGGGAGGQGGFQYIAYYDKSQFTGTFDVSGGSHGGGGVPQVRNLTGTGVNPDSVPILSLTGKGVGPIVINHAQFSTQDPLLQISITGVQGNTQANRTFAVATNFPTAPFNAAINLVSATFDPVTHLTTRVYGGPTILTSDVITLVGNKNWVAGTGTMNLIYGSYGATFGTKGDNGQAGTVLLFQLS